MVKSMEEHVTYFMVKSMEEQTCPRAHHDSADQHHPEAGLGNTQSEQLIPVQIGLIVTTVCTSVDSPQITGCRYAEVLSGLGNIQSEQLVPVQIGLI